jgi:DNA-binding winged helix-turn-helix (wHTH) protein
MSALREQKERVYEFDNFRLDAANRQLLRDERPVVLSSKAFDLLLALIESSGRLLTKEELFDRVWPEQAVEESNLTVHVSAIRKALGDSRQNPRYLFTVPGHGYRFAGAVFNLDEVDELEVETETFSRIVVEREEADAPEVPAAGSAPALIHRGGTRRKARAATAALLGLLLLAGTGDWLSRRWDQNRGQQPQAVAPPPARQITMRRFTTAGGVHFRVAISPDGKSLVYLQRIRGKHSPWLGQIESNSNVQINQPSHSLYGSLVFAPDGGSIYFNLQDDNHPQWTLLRMPVLGGPTTELIRG